MEEEKKGPSDGSSYYQEGDNDEQSEKDKKMKEKDELYKKEMEELEEAGKQARERREEGLKQYKKKDADTKKQIRKEEEEIKIGGQKVKSQKDFLSTLKENKSPFKHKKLQNFSTSGGKKIEKILKRVSGVSSKEKKEFYSGLKAYGIKKSVLKESELKEYYMGVKHKFRGFRGKAGFKKMGKNLGDDDLNNLKKIKRRSAEKMFDALSGAGKKKHQIKQSSNRNPGSGRPGSTSPSRIKNR